MGNILVAYYAKAKEIGGLNAQVKLAMLTCLSLPRAKETPDSPEIIKKFEEAMKKL